MGHSTDHSSEHSGRAAFCAYLRTRREARELSLDEISRITKIPQRSLERLEQGRFEELPADVFVRGFLRSYAECVGLDAEDTVGRYARCGLEPSPVAAPEAAQLVSPEPERKPKKSWRRSKRRDAVAPDSPMRALPAAPVTEPALLAAAPEPLDAMVAAVEAVGAMRKPAEVVDVPAPNGARVAEAESASETASADETSEAPSTEAVAVDEAPVAEPTVAVAADSEPAVEAAPVEESPVEDPTAVDSSTADATSETSSPPRVAARTTGGSRKRRKAQRRKAKRRKAKRHAAARHGDAQAVSTVEPAPETEVAADAQPEVAEAEALAAPTEPVHTAEETVAAEAASTPVESEVAPTEPVAVPADEAAASADAAPDETDPASVDAVPATPSQMAEEAIGDAPFAIPTDDDAPVVEPMDDDVVSSANRVVRPPVLIIDDEAPDLAEQIQAERKRRGEDSLLMRLPAILRDPDTSNRRGPLTLAVIILVIVATLTMSYLLRTPSSSGDGVTRADDATPTRLV